MPSLLDMPIEVRFLVYEHLFTGATVAYIPAQPGKLHHGKDPGQGRWCSCWKAATEGHRMALQGVEVLLASKLCRAEAFQMLQVHANVNLTKLHDFSCRRATKELAGILSRIRYVSTSPHGHKRRGFNSYFELLTNLELVFLSDQAYICYMNGYNQYRGPALEQDGSLTQTMCGAIIAALSTSIERHLDSVLPQLISRWDLRGRTFAIKCATSWSYYEDGPRESRFLFKVLFVVRASPGAQAPPNLPDTPISVEVRWEHAGSQQTQILDSTMGEVLWVPNRA
jgi:hypothetical protein